MVEQWLEQESVEPYEADVMAKLFTLHEKGKPGGVSFIEYLVFRMVDVTRNAPACMFVPLFCLILWSAIQLVVFLLGNTVLVPIKIIFQACFSRAQEQDDVDFTVSKDGLPFEFEACSGPYIAHGDAKGGKPVYRNHSSKAVVSFDSTAKQWKMNDTRDMSACLYFHECGKDVPMGEWKVFAQDPRWTQPGVAAAARGPTLTKGGVVTYQQLLAAQTDARLVSYRMHRNPKYRDVWKA